jgi:hypothetical protein
MAVGLITAHASHLSQQERFPIACTPSLPSTIQRGRESCAVKKALFFSG